MAVAFMAIMVSSWVYTTWCWFDSLGYSSVFWKINLTRLGCAVLFGGGFFVIAALNLYLAWRFGARTREFILKVDPESPPVRVSAVAAQVILVIAVGLPSLISFIMALTRWPVVLRFLYRQPFNLADPIFGRDVGFYVFSLPFALYVRNWLFGALLLSTLLTAGFYRHARMINPVVGAGVWGTLKNIRFSPRVKTHLGVLTSLLLLCVAWGYRLKMFQLLYSRRGVAYGASYTDVNAQLVAYWVLFFAAIAFGILLFAAVWQRNLKWPVAGLAGMLALWLIFSKFVPSVVTQLIVKPNEISKEREYIGHNIEFTRRAYCLDKIIRIPFPAELALDGDAIGRNEQTIENIRLWDARPLKQTYSQRQELRTYYEFENVDVDRYVIDGKYRQVMLSAREMSSEQLPSKTWVNEHLKFTHGYGIVMNPVNQITREGLPFAFIEDIPPVSNIDLEVERPEIYYGEITKGYAIVGTKEEEFDYPHGDTNRYTTYAGSGGVRIGSFLRRLAFACRFAAPNIMFTGYITTESRVMLHRQIQKRVWTAAPFLMYDKDPYMVISGGKLYWIQDAYTRTTMYPYSEPFTGGGEQSQKRVILNYIRNSVKVIIDAYEGKMTFCVVDDTDPIVRAYVQMFPALFRPFEEIPEDLKKHIRYPQDMFMIQTSMYNVYHMKDPNVFYNREDLWVQPTENYGGREQKMLPYYMIMKMPGQDKEEFLLMLPATPSNKRNMIALLIARSDMPHYGELFACVLPKEKLIYGPMQVEARIDQDTDISKELTLWGQMGSQVIRGHLLVVPVEESLLYVEPVYLQATEGELPELKRVIVAYGERIAMAKDLRSALSMIFEGIPEPVVADTARPGPVTRPHGGTVSTKNIEKLVGSALKHYENAMKHLKSGDWAKYGEELRALESALIELKKVARSE